MIRIQLIITGSLEHAALKQSLSSLFPTTVVEFSASQIQHSFTSSLIQTPYAPPPTKALAKPNIKERLPNIEQLFAEAISTAKPKGPGYPPFDYGIIIDDLEVPNLGPTPQAARTQAQNVITFAKQALSKYLQRPENQTTELAVPFRGQSSHIPPAPFSPQTRKDFFRTRCSLHFLSPMVEALFFGDPQAPQNAGTKIPSLFDPSTHDLEDFYVTHPDYPGWISPNQAPWYQPWMQYKHPKDYLEFLRKEPYRELHGRPALETLNWQQVLKQPKHAQFTRALLDDIAQMTNTTLPWITAGTSHPLTCYKPNNKACTLRNM